MEYNNQNDSSRTSAPWPSENQSEQELKRAATILAQLIQSGEGRVSTKAFKAALRDEKLVDIEGILDQLKYQEKNLFPNGEIPTWKYFGASFYSETAYAQVMKEEEEDSDSAENIDEENEIEPERKKNKSPEAKLGKYVKAALEDIYDSDHASDEYVFDVHTERPASDYRNVDLIAIDWRSPQHVDLISVEVKMDFTTKLVQQAANYTRFSNRVWIAVPLPVNTDPAGASQTLRNKDPLLFDHVIELGIGILACRKSMGSSYEVFPIHWPRLLKPIELERHNFLECYREHFERALVLQRKVRTAA